MGPYLSNLPHPAAHARTRHRSAPVVMALVAMLVLAWSLMGQASGDAQARVGVRNAPGVIAVGTMPGDGAPFESPHHPVERKKPRQFELAVASQTQADTDSGACAPASSAVVTPIIGTDAPVVDTASTNRIVDTAQLSLVSADAGRLRLHPGQAPPSA
jgi:hypothetical protein